MMRSLEESQKNFYHNKYVEFGDDPRALSWNDNKTQDLRFQKLAELFKYETSDPFSVHEIGCGLAHFKNYLDSAGYNYNYSGSDIVPAFIEHNKKKYPACDFYLQNINVDSNEIDDGVKGKDYYCLSGTFHTREENTIGDWESFVYNSIKNMFGMAQKGISFNFLTKYSDFYDDRLYYADPKDVLGWIVQNLSRFVVISHDVPLYEFFVSVYKEDHLSGQFPAHKKYFKGLP